MIVRAEWPVYIRWWTVIVSVGLPLVVVDQVVRAWSPDPSGISVVVFVTYLIRRVVSLVFGITIRDRPLILESCLLVVMESSILVGVLR